jgi:PST family polysaccharide transporter
MAAKVVAILAPVGALQSIMATVGSIYQARCRTDLLMRWGIGSGIVILSSFVIGLRWGIVGVALSYTVAMVLIIYHCFTIPFKLIGLRLSELWHAVKRPLACSLAMFLATWAVHECVGNALGSGLTLLLLIGVGGVTYGSLTWAINRESFLDLLAAITLRRTLGDAV